MLKKFESVLLQLYLTQDFIMELLSYGPNLKLRSLELLVERVKVDFEKGLKRYE